MTTVLVTGGSGLLGRVVLERLSGRAELVALCRPGADPPRIAGVSWVPGDLRISLGAGLPSEIDAVLHLAQSRDHRRFPASAPEVFDVNAGSTVRLLDLCRRRGGSHFVQASSGAVYRPGRALLHERDLPDPPSFYGHTKLAAEHAALAFREFFSVSILRFFFVYGARQDAEAFIPGLLGRVRRGEAITLAGERGFRCNPIHVDEAADAVIAAMTSRFGGVCNVAGPEVVDLREIAEILGDLADARLAFEHRPAAGDLTADVERMTEALVRPRIGVGEGLAREFG